MRATFESYDKLWAGKWGDQQRYGPVHRHQRRQLLKLIRRLDVQTVLDVGCGSGDNLAAIAREMPGITLAGTDVSGEALAAARERLPWVHFHRLDIQKERLDRQFDLVLCNQVVEHLLDDISGFRNLCAMARKWVVIATMSGRMRASELAIGHCRNYSNVELREKAEDAGLEVVDIRGWGFPFYSPLYRTAIEWLPGGTPEGKFGPLQKAIAGFLYILYYLNIPRCGDVVTMLARPKG